MDVKRAQLKLVITSSAVALLIALVLWYLLPGRSSILPMAFDPTCEASGMQRTYTTQFPFAENPISEHGNWTVSGGNFANVRTTPGLAFGTQTGTKTNPGKYDDFTALLTGNWGPDQFVQIVVHYPGFPHTTICLMRDADVGLSESSLSPGLSGVTTIQVAAVDRRCGRVSYHISGPIDIM